MPPPPPNQAESALRLAEEATREAEALREELEEVEAEARDKAVGLRAATQEVSQVDLELNSNRAGPGEARCACIPPCPTSHPPSLLISACPSKGGASRQPSRGAGSVPGGRPG